MGLDWQQIVTFGIVGVAFVAVGRRLLVQAIAFRKSSPDSKLTGEASACAGCDGCGPKKVATAQPQLVNISLNAPQRIRPTRRIPNDFSRRN